MRNPWGPNDIAEDANRRKRSILRGETSASRKKGSTIAYPVSPSFVVLAAF
jgi:hypothetical protein